MDYLSVEDCLHISTNRFDIARPLNMSPPPSRDNLVVFFANEAEFGDIRGSCVHAQQPVFEDETLDIQIEVASTNRI